MKYETKKERQEHLNKMCKCGHKRGSHTYCKGSYCTLYCDCKKFVEDMISEKNKEEFK